MELIGALMQEHRLIERVVRLMQEEMERVNRGEEPDLGLIGSFIEFIHSYADLVHHGKEEDILFKSLAEKPLTPEHRNIMNGLIADHESSRNSVATLLSAKNAYAAGNPGVKSEIVSRLNNLVKLYPGHIATEDKQFFFPTLEYFTRQERDSLLLQGREFDRKFIHDQYRLMVEELEKSVPNSRQVHVPAKPSAL